MTHPSFSTISLLVIALAAVLTCPPVVAKPKATVQKPAETVTKAPPKAIEVPANQKEVAAKKQPAKKNAAPSRTTAPATKRSSPAPAKKTGRQTEGDGPGKPANPPVSLIADPAELLARVPASGPLGEEDLILLAIANNPTLERRRADIALARADQRAVQDLENPELRLSYGSQDEDFVRRPYTETTLRSRTVPFPGTTSFTKIERAITPRSDGEDVVIKTTEVFPGSDPNVGIIDYERTTTTGFDGTDTEFSALVRFRVPHRFEKKARIQRAAAEIVLAEAQYLADEDKLVREMRDFYETLAVLQSTLAAQEKRRGRFSTFRSEMVQDNFAEFAMDATRARVEMTKALTDMQDIEADILRTRADLASLCGLSDPSRISTSGLRTRRVVDLAALDVDYLVEMAMLYRADMVESRGRLGIAKAHLAEADAKKIPWFSFIDAGFSRQRRDGSTGEQDEWSVRVGIEIPLFEWSGINKRSAAYRNAAAEFERQMEKQRQRVTTDVTLAIHRLRGAASMVRRFESKIHREHNELKADLTKLEAHFEASSQAGTADLNDLSRLKRATYDVEDQLQQMDIGRYEAWSDYNKALMYLEDAVGVRIEKVLDGSRAK